VLANVDTNQTSVFKETPDEVTLRFLALFVIAGGMGLVAWLQSDQPIPVRITAAIVAFCVGAVGAVQVVTILKGKYRILTLAPNGFQDTNIAPEIVPWAAVEGMTIVSTSFRGRERLIAVQVKIKDFAWNALTLSRSAKLNKYQTGGMWIMPISRGADFQTFFETLRSYARSHGGKVD
jgi:hypothetical protein